MTEFAYFTFMSNSMLTMEEEEEEHKDEIIAFTKEVLQARGVESDSRISKISEEQLKETLEEIRQLRKKNKKSKDREQLEVAIQ
jgi:nucleotide-binding universal stress UspA family protein